MTIVSKANTVASIDLIIARFNGEIVKGLEWIETERAQQLYIADNAKHAFTVKECSEQAEALQLAIIAVKEALAHSAFFNADGIADNESTIIRLMVSRANIACDHTDYLYAAAERGFKPVDPVKDASIVNTTQNEPTSNVMANNAPAKPLYQVEFPDFPQSDWPNIIPEGFVDSSWHNDICPSLINETLKLQIFINYSEIAKREFEDGFRFRLLTNYEDDRDNVTLYESNVWSEILQQIKGRSVPALAESAKPVEQSVWVLTAEHFEVPGIITQVHGSEASAELAAVKLVQIMTNDSVLQTETVTLTNWRDTLIAVQDEHGARDCYCDIEEHKIRDLTKS